MIYLLRTYFAYKSALGLVKGFSESKACLCIWTWSSYHDHDCASPPPRKGTPQYFLVESVGPLYTLVPQVYLNSTIYNGSHYVLCMGDACISLLNESRCNWQFKIIIADWITIDNAIHQAFDGKDIDYTHSDKRKQWVNLNIISSNNSCTSTERDIEKIGFQKKKKSAILM